MCLRTAETHYTTTAMDLAVDLGEVAEMPAELSAVLFERLAVRDGASDPAAEHQALNLGMASISFLRFFIRLNTNDNR